MVLLRILLYAIFCLIILSFCFGQLDQGFRRVKFDAERDLNSLKLLEFTNFALEDQRTNQVYVGARNRLYQLNSNLIRDSSPIFTGPVRDDTTCDLKNVEHLTDNLNKLLLVDYRNNRVIACGSVEQGICDLLEIGNIKNRLINYNISDYAPEQHVAASGNLSTTAFLVTLEGEEYMFVGSSKTSFDTKNCEGYTNAFSFARRILPIKNTSPDMFSNKVPNAIGNGKAGIKMKKEGFADTNFRLEFVDAFANSGTGYFVLTHPSSPIRASDEQIDTTFIAQVCLKDSFMNSYFELPLECNDEVSGITYTKAVASHTAQVGSILKSHFSTAITNEEASVVFISFVQANGQPGGAVCMFPLEEIERKFSQLVKRCMKYHTGSKPRSISWVDSNENLVCLNAFNVSTPVCHLTRHLWEVVKFLEGRTYTARAIFASSNTSITAIQVARTNDNAHTIMYLGTDDGYMLKVKLDSPSSKSSDNALYAKVPINPYDSQTTSKYPRSYFAVNQIKIGFERTSSSPRIYAMTPSKLVGMPLFDCAQFEDCTACLNSNDPFCGWCTLESKCTSSNNCRSLHSSNSFVFIRSGSQCPSLTSTNLLPLVLTVAQSQVQITLRGRNIPYLQERYFCNFGREPVYRQQVTGIQRENSAKNSPLLIQCVTPPRSLIPRFPPEEGNLTLPLFLVYGVGKSAKVIASTAFTFYNCSVFSSCVSCVKSHFNCSWCLEDNICRYQSTSYCPQSNVHQSNSCPQLSSPSQQKNVYLPVGERRDVDLPVRNLPDKWTVFTCEIDFHNGKNPVIYVGSRGDGGSKIRCRNVEGSLPDNLRSQQASVRVSANGNLHKLSIDNPENVAIEIYRCALGSNENCGLCIESPAAWKCGWCQRNNMCTLYDDCRANWLQNNRHETCRNPKITGFSPRAAPFNSSSTLLTLTGHNFDSKQRMLVTVAGAPCTVTSATCCEIQCKPASDFTSSGPIEVCITDSFSKCVPRDEYFTRSAEAFHFVDPQIDHFEPRSALKSWGFTMSVYGRNLDAGNEVLISVAGSSCDVIKRSATEIQCRLPCAASKSKRDVANSALRRLSRSKRSFLHSDFFAIFDGIHRTSKTGYFVFEDNPSISRVEPPCTIKSGGLPLIVHGARLNLIPDPRLIVQFSDGTSKTQVCGKYEGDSISCIAPDMSHSPLFETEAEVSGRVGVYNDGCGLRTLWFKSSLRYGPDPILDVFEGEKTKSFRNHEPLYITGRNLCADQYHCNTTAVRVLIGDDLVCNVTRLDVDQITCFPQVSTSDGIYDVQVFIGGYSQHVGYLEYSKAGFPFVIIVIAAGIVLVVLFVITIVVCVYRKRAKASDQELKNVQMQMDLMDAKVAKICKEAFAELQTDMCQLDTYAGGAGMPFLSYSAYLMRVLFPDPSTIDLQHSLLHDTLKRNSPYGEKRNIYGRDKTRLDRFDDLLGNKIFLLCLIKTIEKQQSFLIKDRAKVAGLIMIILHNRLQYATEILEHLLADLINRNMESRSHPKLLLRRTESVAEKMLTHWFSILLHGFVVECAGELLYTLFRAIKQQVDKGPLDTFTNEARYSLSEDKLLRQSVDHDVILLRVRNYLDDEEKQDFSVKVLSCDSILQVKTKILDVGYMGVGYSQRPHPEEIDIEVMQNKLLPLILQDEDTTSEIEAEWKRVNTLKHYEIKSGTKVALIHKREPSIYNYSLVTAPSKSSLFRTNGTGSSFKAFSSGDSVTSSLPRHKQALLGTLTLQHNTTKQWHLVKPSDQDQLEGGDRGSKMVSEVYLTRLLTTKGTIQKYVDDLFETIFSVVQRGHDLPIAVKHMFDFLDHQADIHDITDPEVVHTWKSNCLPLRFWVNLIKNPEFIYDIHKSPIVDCYLSVIAQAFMDSCSTAEYKLGKDSPSNKLLYAKEIPEYRKWVKRYYSDISNRSKLNPRELAQFLQDESRAHANEFNRSAALSQLFVYVQKYSDDILTQLTSEPEANRQGLDAQLNQLLRAVNGRT